MKASSTKLIVRLTSVLVVLVSVLCGTSFGMGNGWYQESTIESKPDGGKKGDSNQDASQEVWAGGLNIGAVKLRLEIVISEQDGKQKTKMISVDQGGVEINVTDLLIADGKLTFKVPQISGSFDGKLNESADEATGTWKQGPNELPLTLKKRASGETTKSTKWEDRPQRPKMPLPYNAVEVTIKNVDANVELGGTLTLPKDGKPSAAVILVSGSGQQDRDETLMEHKPFLVLADHLTRQGIAVLRYDDRGAGKSTGDFATATSNDFAGDALAAIKFLNAHPQTKNAKLGIIGHSEGGLIAPLVANMSDLVDFNVLLAGPGVDGEAVILSQSKAIAKGMGASDSDLEKASKLNKKLMGIVRSSVGQKDISDDLRTAFEQWVASLDESERAEAKSAAAGVAQMSTPWFRNFIVYDPAPALAANKCPTLALLGGKDLQVLVDPNKQAIEEALAMNQVEGNELVVFPNLNHLFQTAVTGLPGEYVSIDETMSPKVMKKITSWIKKR